MPIILGRALSPQDTMTSRKVAVINETMGQTYFGALSPLGGTFSIADTPDWQDIEVVGVVKDAKYMDLKEKLMPAAFYPHSQHAGKFLYNFIARCSGTPQRLGPLVASVIRQIDPNLPVDNFTTLSQIVDDSVSDHRLVARLCQLFGLVAVSLSCLGIYGLMSYGVTRRTSEFGVRMALGAQRGNILWLVLRDTLGLCLFGIAVGLALTPVLGRMATSFLYGLKSYDPLTLGLAMFVMISVALLGLHPRSPRCQARSRSGTALRIAEQLDVKARMIPMAQLRSGPQPSRASRGQLPNPCRPGGHFQQCRAGRRSVAAPEKVG